MRNYFNDPAGIELARINKIYGLDQWFNVKLAAEYQDAPSLKDYAYPDKMLYPIDTPERTALSWCYVKESKDIPAEDLPRVMIALKEAVDFWDIPTPARLVEEKVEVDITPITFKVASEGVEDTIAINSPENLLQVVDLIRKTAGDFSYDTRRQLAAQTLAAPSEMKVRLTRDDILFLQKTAGDMLVTSDDIRLACATRAIMVNEAGHPDLANILKEAADSTPKEGFVPKKALIKVSCLIDYATRAAGLKTADDPNLLPVELLLKGIPESEVRRFTQSVLALKNGSAVAKKSVVDNRDEVNEFFNRVAGENVCAMDEESLFNRIDCMDDIEANAFVNVTGLTIH